VKIISDLQMTLAVDMKSRSRRTFAVRTASVGLYLRISAIDSRTNHRTAEYLAVLLIMVKEAEKST
jgi:hypothetical protein